MPETNATPKKTAPAGARPRQVWLMRLAAAILVPATFLGVLELGLRLMGFGYPTAFFLPRKMDGEDYLYTNHAYTYRFFPPALARTPIPQRILAEKPDSTYRIFIFGESAANGDPDAAYSFGRHLEVLLQKRYPGTTFEVVCTAITAVNSHAILPIARECAQLEGDLWIIYMGNNEMVGTYGAGTIFGSKAPSLAVARTVLALKTTRLGQLMDTLVQSARSRKTEAPETWEGIGMFMDNLLTQDDPGRLQVYDNFQGNLEDMLAAAEGAGVPVLLSTVASNLIDCSPFASLHAEALTEDQKAAWNGFYEEGKRLEAVASYAEALGQYADAAAIDVAHADLQFRMGRSLAAQGDWNAAREAFKRARDADGLVVRADSRINAIIREAATSGMASLVDVEASLAADFPGGIPGQALFYEHVHYTLRGNYELARLMAEKVAAALPSRITAGDEGSWAEPASCQLRLAATFWDKQRLWDEMKERLSVPPFTAQDSNPDNLAYIEEKSRENLSRVNPGFDWKLYQLATEARPEDYHMHARFGHYLLSNGAFDEAIRELQWVCNTFPDFEGGHQQLGIALFLAKRFDEAEASFQRVLELRPGYVKAEKALELIQKERP